MTFQHYSTPGVYPQEVFLQPSLELPTGVPAFIGLVPLAEVDTSATLQPLSAGVWKVIAPQETSLPPEYLAPISRWSEWGDRFGPTTGSGYLAHAVHGFFLNGGRLCYPLVLCFEQDVSPIAALDAALQVLAANQAFDLVCAPDVVRSSTSKDVIAMQAMLLDHCGALGDRFAILDALSTDDLQEVSAQAAALHSANGALYAPWLDIGLCTGAPQNQPVFVPPCGHVAGVYARTDGRIGVHKAPANEALEGVLDLSLHLHNTQQASLNAEAINCLRSFPGRGIRVWGARTLSEEPAWRYINVRRTVLTACRWIERHMDDIAFQPNDARLWSRIQRELTAYFTGVFHQGALQGSTAQEAFYVACDASTNSPEARQQGHVITEIGLAPTTPNEFIVVRMIHKASGATIAAPVLPG